MVQILENKGEIMLKQNGKKFVKLSLSAVAVFTLTACASSQPSPKTAAAMNVSQVCSVEKSGLENVIATAKLYNMEAQKRGLEFRRLNVNNSALIASVEEAMKKGAKEVNPMHFKGKKKSKTKLPTNYAAQRACKFAVAALSQAEEAKSTWRLAIPGDGFKY